MKKKAMRLFLLLPVLCGLICLPVCGASLSEEEINGEAAVLMEASTGQILWSKNADRELAPASVTKIMTLLLAMEALERKEVTLEETVRVSAYAASMGGSQVYMAEGEEFTLHEVLKCIAVSSANDASVALAEHLCGTVGAFAEKMNTRARELGCKHTCFVNCTGLPASGHYMSAGDIALISRELLKHKEILNYTTIRSDSIRNGAFVLTNTNKLLSSFEGITGLKTGSTAEAGYCMSATAERNGMTLIAVVIKSDTGAERFSSAAALLEYGFANYTLAAAEPPQSGVKVSMGSAAEVELSLGDEPAPVLPKNPEKEITVYTELPDSVCAPVSEGEALGKIVWSDGEQIFGQVSLTAKTDVPRISFLQIFKRIMASLFFLCPANAVA